MKPRIYKLGGLWIVANHYALLGLFFTFAGAYKNVTGLTWNA